MSINSISGSNSYYGINNSDMIKPETRQKLKQLGIDESSVNTETQAQNKIQEKFEEISEQIKERVQANASQNIQQPQESSQQYQYTQENGQTQGVEGVDGLNKTQQVGKADGISEQYGIQNQQTGNEEVKAFAGSGAAQQAEPFALSNDMMAMYNKFKLGLF